MVFMKASKPKNFVESFCSNQRDGFLSYIKEHKSNCKIRKLDSPGSQSAVGGKKFGKRRSKVGKRAKKEDKTKQRIGAEVTRY